MDTRGDRLVPRRSTPARSRPARPARSSRCDRHAQGAEERSEVGRPEHQDARRRKTGNTGKHKTLPPIEKKSLAEQLLDEAREVELSESGIRKLPKNDSLLSRMLGKLTK